MKTKGKLQEVWHHELVIFLQWFLLGLPLLFVSIIVAAVLTYIRNEWGNEAALVTPETVGRIRSEVGTRGPWTDAELEPYK